MADSRYVIGIDGGGTKTLATLISFEGIILGSGQGGSANFDSVGTEVAKASIRQAVESAQHTAGVQQQASAVFLGLAGVVAEKDRQIIRQIAHELRLADDEHVGVDHDCEIALAAGLSGRPGVVLIAGTGSSCFGRNAAGERWRAGGWGYPAGDEGSSYWLGVQALIAAIRAYDGRGAQTLLQAAVMEFFQITDMNAILHLLNTEQHSKAEIAKLAQRVIWAAQEGDAVSLALLDRGMSDLADCVVAVSHKLQLPPACEVALVGGLFSAGDLVLRPLRAHLAARLPHVRTLMPEYPPVLGACWLALRLCGVHLPLEQVIRPESAGRTGV